MKQTGLYRRDRKVGEWSFYYPSGPIRIRSNYKDGERHGPYISYDKQGQIVSKGNYKNGKREGPWVHRVDNFGKGEFTGEKGYHSQSGIYRDGRRVACLPITPPKLCVIEP